MDINYGILLPEMILSLTAIGLMLAAPSQRPKVQSSLFWVALLGLSAALLVAVSRWGSESEGYFGMAVEDNLANFGRVLFLLAAATVVLISRSYLRDEKLLSAEFLILILLATVGMGLMATSSDLIMTFLGIEVLSIASYVLAGYRADAKSAEAAWKYFILGAFSTAFLLYGIAILYGITGSTRYVGIAGELSGINFSFPLGVAVVLILVGFAFKAALAPFHVWTPDVYEGAPIPITAYLAVASKAAAFVAGLRILLEVIPGLDVQWQALLSCSAVLIMLVGNIAALTQTNIKRMLAYSSIAHAGYLLVGVTANNSLGVSAVLFYLASYALMTLGAFTVVQLIAGKGEHRQSVLDYSGMAYRNPFLSLALAAFLISMAGIPATAGFMGKLFLFSAAVKSQFYGLVVIALIASAIGIYYYLRVVVLMFFREVESSQTDVRVPTGAGLVILVMVVGTFVLGLFPGALMQIASEVRVF